MDIPPYTDLTDDELDALLGRNEIAVLALAGSDDPYAIPTSYGYDGVERRFYLQLLVAPDSEKRQYLGATTRARLVVTERRDETLSSVIADGILRKVFRDELTVEQIHQYGGTMRPLLDRWGDARDVELYELDPETLTGRRFSRDTEA